MNQINNEQNNQQFDYETQREYAVHGQLDNELKDEEEDNLLVEQILQTIEIVLGKDTRREIERYHYDIELEQEGISA